MAGWSSSSSLVTSLLDLSSQPCSSQIFSASDRSWMTSTRGKSADNRGRQRRLRSWLSTRIGSGEVSCASSSVPSNSSNKRACSAHTFSVDAPNSRCRACLSSSCKCVLRASLRARRARKSSFSRCNVWGVAGMHGFYCKRCQTAT